MDMNGHNGTYGGDPRIMNLARVCVQCFPKALETTRMLSRPCADARRGGATCQNHCVCVCVRVFMCLTNKNSS